MKRKLLSLIVGAALLAPSLVSAIELGAVKIRSKSGAALRADIPISTKKLSNDVSLMLDAQTAKQGRRILNSLNVSVVKRNGRNYVRLTSDKPINESVLEFSLRLIAPEGSAARRYVINLPQTSHLPEVRRVRQAQKMHLGGKAVASNKKTEKTSATATAQKKPRLPKNLKVTNLKGGFYGPVRGGETLLNIAAKTRPSKSISLNDMVQAIRVANPDTTSPLQIDAKLFIPTIKGYAPYRGKTNNQPEEITVESNDNSTAYNDTSMRPVLIEQQTAPVETPVVDDGTSVVADNEGGTDSLTDVSADSIVENAEQTSPADIMDLSTAETVSGDEQSQSSSSNVRIISSLSETQTDSEALATSVADNEEKAPSETTENIAETTTDTPIIEPVETPIVLESTASETVEVVETNDNSQQETLEQTTTETIEVVEETPVEPAVTTVTETAESGAQTPTEPPTKTHSTPTETSGSLVDKITGSLLILLSIFAIVGGWLFLIKPRKKGKKDLKQAATAAIAAGKTAPEPTPVKASHEIDEGHVEGWSVSARKVSSDEISAPTETLDDVNHIDDMDNALLTPVIDTTGTDNEPKNGVAGAVDDWAVSAKKAAVATEDNLAENIEEEKLSEITLAEMPVFSDLPDNDNVDTVIDEMANEGVIEETLTPEEEIIANETPTEEAADFQEFNMDIDISADDIVRFEPSAQNVTNDSNDNQPQNDDTQESLVEDNVDYEELVANLLPKEDLEQIELDLAQASEIPVAKSDYAKALLEEIVARGDDEQAENAQKLLDSLAG